MSKLALAAVEGSEFGRGRALLVIDSPLLPGLSDRLRETVLVAQVLPGVMASFVGTGELAGVNLGHEGKYLLTLDPYTPFARPITDTETVGTEASYPRQIPDERFEEILELALEPDFGLHEAAAPFLLDAPTVETYVMVNDAVLQTWDYHCAFTGAQFEPGHRLHPQLRVVAIRAREHGGPLHARNYLPMIEALEGPWQFGHLAIGPGFRMLLDGSRLAPEVQDLLRPEFRLLLPEREADWPDPEQLRWHYEHVFGRS